MSTPTRKTELLERIEHERQAWERLLAAIGEERMLEPGATDGWSFKDVVAHLNGWRVRTLDRLDAARRGGEPAPPPWPADFSDATDEGVEQINDWIYRAAQGRSLEDVLAESRRSFDLMRDAVSALSEQELTDPQRFPWMGGEPVGVVIDNSFSHLHEEHESALNAWLDRIGRRG